MNRQKVLIVCPGDTSVGIPDNHVWIEMNLDWFDDEEKEVIRERLTNCFSEIYDTKAQVYLSEDEIYPY